MLWFLPFFTKSTRQSDRHIFQKMLPAGRRNPLKRFQTVNHVVESVSNFTKTIYILRSQSLGCFSFSYFSLKCDELVRKTVTEQEQLFSHLCFTFSNHWQLVYGRNIPFFCAKLQNIFTVFLEWYTFFGNCGEKLI